MSGSMLWRQEKHGLSYFHEIDTIKRLSVQKILFVGLAINLEGRLVMVKEEMQMERISDGTV